MQTVSWSISEPLRQLTRQGQYFSDCPNITSKHRSIDVFKTFVKQNNDWNKTCTYVHELLLPKLHLSKRSSSWLVSVKQNINFNFQQRSTFVCFVCHKNFLTKCCSFSEDVPAYRISWCHGHWIKFCIHLRSLNAYHIGMVEDAGLRSMASKTSLPN
jgi:hypothetical protein